MGARAPSTASLAAGVSTSSLQSRRSFATARTQAESQAVEEEEESADEEGTPSYLFQASVNLSLAASTTASCLSSMVKDELQMRKGDEISPGPMTRLLVCVQGLNNAIRYRMEGESDLGTILSSDTSTPTLSYSTLTHPTLLGSSFSLPSSPYTSDAASPSKAGSALPSASRRTEPYFNDFERQPPAEFLRMWLNEGGWPDTQFGTFGTHLRVTDTTLLTSMDWDLAAPSPIAPVLLPVSSRLFRQLFPIVVPELSENDLHSIFGLAVAPFGADGLANAKAILTACVDTAVAVHSFVKRLYAQRSHTVAFTGTQGSRGQEWKESVSLSPVTYEHLRYTFNTRQIAAVLEGILSCEETGIVKVVELGKTAAPAKHSKSTASSSSHQAHPSSDAKKGEGASSSSSSSLSGPFASGDGNGAGSEQSADLPSSLVPSSLSHIAADLQTSDFFQIGRAHV